jgi:hypothetical protein
MQQEASEHQLVISPFEEEEERWLGCRSQVLHLQLELVAEALEQSLDLEALNNRYQSGLVELQEGLVARHRELRKVEEIEFFSDYGHGTALNLLSQKNDKPAEFTLGALCQSGFPGFEPAVKPRLLVADEGVD